MALSLGVYVAFIFLILDYCGLTKLLASDDPLIIKKRVRIISS
jgi:hypothetical protein